MSATTLRLVFFMGLLLLLALAEALWPRQRGRARRGQRWATNLGMVVIDTLALRLLLPWTAVLVALWAEAHGIGLLNLLHVPVAVAWAITLLTLDLVIYGQHRLTHGWAPLWRLHRVHHTDLALDVTSALRFHPLEIILSMLVKIVAVLALGAPAGAVLTFEVLLNGLAMFNHANLALPVPVDHVLRWLIVTPDMHRIHHRPERDEHDRNYGFNLSIWDRLFGSYREWPAAPQETMELGLHRFREDGAQRLDALLLQPLRGDAEH
ncbi:MAG: sterol desaturase family protein [Betaproteobacteria bacterium]|nr:sterol desaturase family protein [Betaproteobacteria bacterium]